LVLAFLGTLGGTRIAQASALDSSFTSSFGSTDTYVENKRGVEAYQEGKLDEAKQHFNAAQAREPSRPELYYNQGLVELGGGDADSAIRSFSEAAQGAMKAGKPDILGKSLFNLGSAFSKKGDNLNALRSYLGAIEAAKASHDPSLEADARKNVELLGQKQEQKQKQKKNQDQKQNQQQDQNQQSQSGQGQGQEDKKPDQKSDKDKDSPKPEKDDKQKDEAKNQPQRYEDRPKEDKFNSKKLTREDAERVFSELNNRELDLQVRQRKQNANQENNTKDW
jgi:tetratricopeptide (TPR) repeat protein